MIVPRDFITFRMPSLPSKMGPVHFEKMIVSPSLMPSSAHALYTLNDSAPDPPPFNMYRPCEALRILKSPIDPPHLMRTRAQMGSRQYGEEPRQ